MSKRKRFKVKNYPKSCGNCGLFLYEDDKVIRVNGFSIVDETYFHKTYAGCVAATNYIKNRINVKQEGKVVTYVS